MEIQSEIERILEAGLHLQHLEVINESGGHNVPEGSETHFKLVMVSSDFDNMPLVARHRRVYELLGGLLKGGVHALAIHALTAQEWQERHGDIPLSPPCLGGEGKQAGRQRKH